MICSTCGDATQEMILLFSKPKLRCQAPPEPATTTDEDLVKYRLIPVKLNISRVFFKSVLSSPTPNYILHYENSFCHPELCFYTAILDLIERLKQTKGYEFFDAHCANKFPLISKFYGTEYHEGHRYFMGNCSFPNRVNKNDVIKFFGLEKYPHSCQSYETLFVQWLSPWGLGGTDQLVQLSQVPNPDILALDRLFGSFLF